MPGTKHIGLSEERIRELRRQRKDLAGPTQGEGFRAGQDYAAAEGEDGATLEEFLWFEQNALSCTDWRQAIAREQRRITDRYGEPERFPADFWRGFAEGVLAVWQESRDAVLED
jgi:hypothetical protein